MDIVNLTAIRDALPEAWRTFAYRRVPTMLEEADEAYYILAGDEVPRLRSADIYGDGYRVTVEPSIGTNQLPSVANERRVTVQRAYTGDDPTRSWDTVTSGTITRGPSGRVRFVGFFDLPDDAQDIIKAMYKALRDELWVLPTLTRITETPKGLAINQTIQMRRGAKRYVITSIEEADDGRYFVDGRALAGGVKQSHLGKFAASDVAFLGEVLKGFGRMPIFYGASAAKRYKDYVKAMEESEHADLIVPFAPSDHKPVEPPPPLAEPDALPYPGEVGDYDMEEEHPKGVADVTIRHVPEEGTTAVYDRDADRKRGKEESIYHALRGSGFVIARRAEGQPMRRTKSVGLPRSVLEVEPTKFNRLKRMLNDRGYTVAHDFQATDLESARAIRQAYLQDRADRTAARAEKYRTEAGYQADYAAEQAKEAIQKMKIPGYFPTPDEVAQRMVVAAGIRSAGRGWQILDPSGGDGSLLRAARAVTSRVETGGPSTVAYDAIEIDSRLAPLLEEQGFAVVGRDVMDSAFRPGSRYNAIVMNPPYERAQSIDHVRRAWTFLAPGGVLVALLPESIWYRDDRKHEAFRDWFSDFTNRPQGEDVDAQAFGRARSIKTRILRLTKPRDSAKLPGSPDTDAAIRRARAAVTAVASQGARGALDRAVEGRPLGQPILVGHHSEGRARAAQKRAEAAARKQYELGQAADRTQARAEAQARAARRGGFGSRYEQGMSAYEAEEARRKAAATATKTPKTRKPANKWKTLMRRLKKPTGAARSVKGYTGSSMHGTTYSQLLGIPVDEGQPSGGQLALNDIVIKVRGGHAYVTIKADNRYDAETIAETSFPKDVDIADVLTWIAANVDPARGYQVSPRYFDRQG